MNVKHVTATFAVSPQVRLEELQDVARQFAMLINNRPDCEEPGQPTSAELEKAAADAGLSYRFVPVVPGKMGEREVREFAEAVSAADGPVLAFCRTGTRSISLWALMQAPERAADAILDDALKAGYDLAGLAERIRAAAQA